MKTLLDVLKSCCLLAAVFALVEAGLAFREAGKVSLAVTDTVAEARGAVAELREAATVVSDYTRHQTKQLLDPRNQKALDAGIQALGIFNGTGRLINREVIPRTMSVLDRLSRAVESLDSAIRATDQSLNAELLPESKRLLAGTSQAIEATAAQINQAGNDIHSILSDPALKSMLAEANGIAAHTDRVAANLEEASKKMPLIAADLERIAATSSRYRKLILLSHILSALGRAFF